MGRRRAACHWLRQCFRRVDPARKSVAKSTSCPGETRRQVHQCPPIGHASHSEVFREAWRGGADAQAARGSQWYASASGHRSQGFAYRAHRAYRTLPGPCQDRPRSGLLPSDRPGRHLDSRRRYAYLDHQIAGWVSPSVSHPFDGVFQLELARHGSGDRIIIVASPRPVSCSKSLRRRPLWFLTHRPLL